MTQRDDGGPAFGHGNHEQGGDPGMSLRDYFAGQALSSIPLRRWDDLADDEKVRAWATLAYEVADAMIAARSPAQEGVVRPTVRVDASMIARLLTGGAVETGHCLLEPREGLEMWGADHSELLREAKSTLHSMLTFYGMDEDPAEMSGAVHKQGRATLAKIQEELGDD